MGKILKNNLLSKFIFVIILGLVIISFSACDTIKSNFEKEKYQLEVNITSEITGIDSNELKLMVKEDNNTTLVSNFKKNNNKFSVNLTELQGEVRLIPEYEGYSFDPPLKFVDKTDENVDFKLQQKDMTVKKRVMAFYYPWYRTEEYSGRYFHWEGIDRDNKSIANSANYPLGGPYDSTNPEVIERHLKQLSKANIDTIIVSWWGKGSPSNEVIDLILDKAPEYGIKVTLYYEENKGDSTEERINNGVSDLKYIFNNYAAHPAYLWSKEKPVIFLYGRIMGQVSSEEWDEIKNKFKEETGFNFAMIADDLSESAAQQFEGIHRYNYAYHMQELLKDYTVEEVENIKNQEFEGWKGLVENNNSILGVPIIPGYDDRKIRNPGIYVSRKDGETYRALWNAAIDANPDWILITSFNEWHEGTELEPSIELGEKYLDITEEKSLEWRK